MERLTFDGNFCDIAMCGETRGGSFCEDGACSQRKTWERLKVIEDVLGISYDLDRLRELVKSEQDGRLVVLPCGEDAVLVRNGYTFKADHWNHSLTAFRDAQETNSGKQVALFSIVEAEDALSAYRERKEGADNGE